MNHTKEPWKYGKELTAHAGEWLISVDAGACWRGNPIAETRPATGDEEANARRIVACVNACAGVTTEELEQSGFVSGLIEQRDELAKLCNYNERVMQELLQQRDELLTSLEKLARLGNDPHYGNSIGNQIARDALSKVGAGGTALEVHGTVFFKDNHQYRSQLRFPIADGAYELVKIENPDMTHPLFHVAGESFECIPDAEGEAHNVELSGPTAALSPEGPAQTQGSASD